MPMPLIRDNCFTHTNLRQKVYKNGKFTFDKLNFLFGHGATILFRWSQTKKWSQTCLRIFWPETNRSRAEVGRQRPIPDAGGSISWS